jgi:hypothetical protein
MLRVCVSDAATLQASILRWALSSSRRNHSAGVQASGSSDSNEVFVSWISHVKCKWSERKAGESRVSGEVVHKCWGHLALSPWLSTHGFHLRLRADGSEVANSSLDITT